MEQDLMVKGQEQVVEWDEDGVVVVDVDAGEVLDLEDSFLVKTI